MDDKVFNLLEKMYSEFTEFKQETKDNFKEINSRISKMEATMENGIKPNIKMCLEEVVSVKEKLVGHTQRFNNIESKIESYDVEISMIKRVK